MAPKEDQQPMTTREELEPCPFCGEMPELLNGAPGSWFVRCKNCKCSTNDVQRDAAVQLWHRRSALTASPGEQKPVAYTNEAQLGFVKDLKYACIPMAMWRARGNAADIPLYLSPPPAAGWDEAIQACKQIVSKWCGIRNPYMSSVAQKIAKEIEALRREAPAPEGVAKIGGTALCGHGVMASICERCRYLGLTVKTDASRPDAAAAEPGYAAGFEACRKAAKEIADHHAIGNGDEYDYADIGGCTTAMAISDAIADLSNPPAAAESNANGEAEVPAWTEEDKAYE